MVKEVLHAVKINRGVGIPMRDGVVLSADIYRPDDEDRHPAIMVRTPYMKNTTSHHENGIYYAERGYAVVIVDVRGRGDSEGVFIPYRNEGDDGYDCIEWAASQSWCDGGVGTMGGSYLGRIQWLTALKQPPHLKTMIAAVTPSDPFVEWPTGTPTPMHICWLYMTSDRVMQNTDVVDWDSVYRHLPHVTMDEKLGKSLPAWREEYEHPYLDDWWKEISYQKSYNKIDLPVLHVSGWYDDELVGTPLNFVGMTKEAPSEAARRNQKLLVGPWIHQINTSSKIGDIDFGPDAIIDLKGYQLRWFDRWLKGVKNSIDEEKPVKIFVMGRNEWVEEDAWPLPQTNWTHYYLHSGGRANSRFGDGVLSIEPPTEKEPSTDHYVYDPENPVPFLTDMVSSQIGGADDYSAIERRDDVLVYSTPALETDIEIIGPLKMVLFAATDALDTDFMVKLLDVHPNGFAQRLNDGMVRARFRNGMEHPELLTPGEIYRYEIDCWDTAHVFKRGHQIRVEIASSAFPKYDCNLNTGAPLGKTTDMKKANQTIYHDPAHPSAMILPVIPRD
ncbi:CocE/NonD family hydrolase [Camelliibacillus cellulosilyticus]|uniref:CocE/NonD family hydrolase n=1 Tax=Camelliibacillus cellulosilyticus TaxID=2174486 RepID=A0ABV9GMX9_9BACL